MSSVMLTVSGKVRGVSRVIERRELIALTDPVLAALWWLEYCIISISCSRRSRVHILKRLCIRCGEDLVDSLFSTSCPTAANDHDADDTVEPCERRELGLGILCVDPRLIEEGFGAQDSSTGHNAWMLDRNWCTSASCAKVVLLLCFGAVRELSAPTLCRLLSLCVGGKPSGLVGATGINPGRGPAQEIRVGSVADLQINSGWLHAPGTWHSSRLISASSGSSFELPSDSSS